MRWLFLAFFSLALLSACTGGERSSSPAYIALGDSLSQGIGASDTDATGFVPLVHKSLGDGYELINLSHSGDTSQDLLDHGHLHQAIAEIEERNGDGDEGNDVRLVTLEIGGNDLLRLYFSLVVPGTCSSVETALERAECVDPLVSALESFKPNLASILDQLKEADPSLTIVLLTLYNPFSHLGGTGEIGELALEGLPGTPFPDGLNDLIRAQAQQREDVTLVDLYPLFQGKTARLIAGDLIHPNDEGYRVMAEAVLGALEEER